MAGLLTVRVTLDGDPTPIDVEVRNPDRVRYEMTAQKHNWPGITDAPFLSMTFMGWHALKRQGRYTGDFEDFRDRDCIDLEPVNEADDDDDAIGDFGNPTPLAAE